MNKIRSGQEKVLKRRYLVALLALGYVGAGFVVPRVDIIAGHSILAGLAALLVVVTWVAFNRYDTAYQVPSWQASVFWNCVALTVGMVIAIIVHIASIVQGNPDPAMLIAVELMTVFLIIIVWLIRAKKHFGAYWF